MSLQSWKVLLWIPLKFPWAIAARWRCFYLGLPNGVLSLSSPIIGKLIMSVAPNTPIGWPPQSSERLYNYCFPKKGSHHWCPRVCGPFLLSSLLFIVFWNFFLECPLHLSKPQLPWMNDFCFFFSFPSKPLPFVPLVGTLLITMPIEACLWTNHDVRTTLP